MDINKLKEDMITYRNTEPYDDKKNFPNIAEDGAIRFLMEKIVKLENRIEHLENIERSKIVFGG